MSDRKREERIEGGWERERGVERERVRVREGGYGRECMRGREGENQRKSCALIMNR